MPPSRDLDSNPNLEVNKNGLEEKLSNAFAFEAGINCEPEQCSVGKLRSRRLGFVELVGNNSGLVRVRSANLFAQDGDEKYFDTDFETDDLKFKEAYTYFYIIGEITGAAIDSGSMSAEEAANVTRKMVTRIKAQQSTCLFGSFSARIGKTLINVETKPSSWIVMTAEAVP